MKILLFITHTFEPSPHASFFVGVMQLDATVLQYQNQKLIQKLEAQKFERSALENKLSQLKEKQKPYDSTLKVVNKSWEAVRPSDQTSRQFLCIFCLLKKMIIVCISFRFLFYLVNCLMGN